jgi:hypothetical protein
MLRADVAVHRMPEELVDSLQAVGVTPQTDLPVRLDRADAAAPIQVVPAVAVAITAVAAAVVDAIAVPVVVVLVMQTLW